MFLAEAQMLAELDHPNIVPVYDIGTTERGDIFIVSKLIDGTDLATRIEQNRPSRELSLEIIAAIAEALHYAHTKGMIHRDIKPANILLDKTDRPYLADFGIALRETDQTGAGEIVGAPACISPEQARGEGHLMSNQSDIYSLGVVLYELLSGRRPFRAKTAHELIRMVQTNESLVPLWLGRKVAAIARLEQGLAGAESADRGLLYNLACAVALFAASETATAEEKGIWTDRAVTLLERWRQNEYDRAEMRENPDLIVLHSDPRFVKLAADRSNVPEQPYWIASREVTRGEFEAFIGDIGYEGEKPTDRRESDLYDYKETSPTLDHPVQNVSWYDAVMYCNWLSRREGRTSAYSYAGKQKIKDYWQGQEIEVDKWEEVEGATGYRLLKEVEWEYACRAGSKTDWSTGSDESLLAAYCQMFPSKLASPSGKKLPNAWGMHDMHGNMWEWCWDPYHLGGSSRVIKGGSWDNGAASCQSAMGEGHDPWVRGSGIGFRLGLSSASGIPKSEK